MFVLVRDVNRVLWILEYRGSGLQGSGRGGGTGKPSRGGGGTTVGAATPKGPLPRVGGTGVVR